jgi:hypothetical protein
VWAPRTWRGLWRPGARNREEATQIGMPFLRSLAEATGLSNR